MKKRKNGQAGILPAAAAGRVLCLCLLLAGCAAGKQESPAPTPEPQMQPAPEDADSWQGAGFLTGGQEEEQLLYVADFERVPQERPQDYFGELHSYGATGDSFYLFDTYYNTPEGVVYTLSRKEAGESGAAIHLTPDQWDIPEGEILGMDVVSSNECVFWVADAYEETPEGEMSAGHYYVVYTDAQGQMKQCTDVAGLLREKEIWKDAALQYGGRDAYCDREGNLYLCDLEKQAVFVLNREGSLIADAALPGGGDPFFCQGIHTADGQLIFACGSGEKPEFVWLDPAGGEMKTLGRWDESLGYVVRWYGLFGETLYYATDRQLVGWNVARGTRSILLDLRENAVQKAENTALLAVGANLRLLSQESEKTYILTLSEQEPEINPQLTVADLNGGNSFLKGRAANFTREHPLWPVQYSQEDPERVLMEVISGQGPDVLYLSQEDLERLAENEALGDLSGLLSQETLESLLPGAAAMGRVGEKLVGLPMSVNLRSLAVSSRYWAGDSWNTEDVLSVMEEHPQLEGIFYPMMSDLCLFNLDCLLGYSEEDIAPESLEELMRVLEEVLPLVRDSAESSGQEDPAAPSAYMDRAALYVREGRFLGAELPVSSWMDFASMGEKLGDEFVPVGYPSRDGSGNFLTAAGLIAVNPKSVEKEGVRLLLEDLFSFESQRYMENGLSVREDVPPSQVIYLSEKKQYAWVEPNGRMTMIDRDPDESSHLEELMQVLHQAVPYPLRTGEIRTIIEEEAEPYFLSQKTLEQVLDVIRSRVGLYLDENG